jgi:hypothetical protein
MAQLSRQYQSADVPQQAFLEYLEQRGAVFPLSELPQRRR